MRQSFKKQKQKEKKKKKGKVIDPSIYLPWNPASLWWLNLRMRL
jgi:hypothetical protein